MLRQSTGVRKKRYSTYLLTFNTVPHNENYESVAAYNVEIEIYNNF